LHIKFIELRIKAHIFFIFPAFLSLLCILLFTGAPAYSQPTVLVNGQPTFTGLDAGINLDTPTRKKIDLSGTWTFTTSDDSWFEKIFGSKEPGQIKVPSSVDYEGRMTFTRKFAVDEQLLNASVFKFVALGINYECEVYVNDFFIGKHTGGYTSFEFEIPDDALQVGSENVVKVVVSNVLNARSTIPVRKQIWGWKNYGGILRDVYLLVTPRLWINDLRVRRQLDTAARRATILLDCTVSNRPLIGSRQDSSAAPRPQRTLYLAAEVYERFTDVLVGQATSVPFSVEPNKDINVKLQLNASAARMWSPESPSLYLLKTSIVEEEKKQKALVDQYDLNTGFVAVRVEGQSLVLNGSKIALKGVVWHEDSHRYGASLSYEQMEKDVALIKSLGANAVRFAFHPPHPYMLDLCSRYGLVAFEEAPVCDVPADLLGDEGFQGTAESQITEMVRRDGAYPCVAAWGIGEQFDSADKHAAQFAAKMKSVVRSLDDRPVYYGSRMLVNDRCAAAVDFVGVTLPPSDLKTFRRQLTEWKNKHSSQPAVILGYGKGVNQDNRRGYTDPMSQESQARYFLQHYAAIKEMDFAGSFISAFADWRADRPLLTYGIGDYSVYPTGLLSESREKRIAFDVVRALYNDERVGAIPSGSYRESFPFIHVLTGLFVIIFSGYMYYTNHRFGESLKRSLLRSYNFFADLRDLHSVSVQHTLIIAGIISLTLAGLVSSLLLHFRGETFADYVLTYVVMSNACKAQIVHAAWHPLSGIALLTGVFFLIGCLLAFLIKLAAFLMRVHVSWFHVYSVSTWAAAPIIFLSPLVMSLFKIMENPFYVLPIVIIIALFLVWTYFRILKGISVIYDFRPVKTYAAGIFFAILVLGGLLFYYDSVYALRPYMKLIAHLAQSTS
jgi:beta-galactosidase